MTLPAEVLSPLPDAQSSAPSSDGSGRKILRRVQALVAKGRWRKVILTIRNETEAAENPRLLGHRLHAAAELGNKVEIKFCQTAIAELGSIGDRIKLAAMLLNVHSPIQAAAILAKLPSDYGTPKTRQIAKRIRRATKDGKARRQTSRFVAHAPKASQNEPVVHRFPGILDDVRVPPSRLEIVRLDGVAPEIEERVRAISAQFAENLTRADKLPFVSEYRDVFINEIGQIWSEDGSVSRSSSRPIPALRDPTSVPIYDEAISCTGPHKGYFEWLVKRLSGLSWRLAPDTPDCPILLRKEHRGLASDALGALGISEDTMIAVEGPVFCRRLYVATSSIANLARTEAYTRVYAELIAIADRRNDRETPRRFYISRRDSARRSMTNEIAFEEALAHRGIVPILLSKLTLLDKINLFRNAELVVGGHGAGLSHLLFAKPGLRVIEILPASAATVKMLGVQSCFTRLSTVFGHNHTLVLQPMDAVTSEWSPDIAAIDRILAVG